MIGKFATSKAGHDKCQLYVIISKEEDYVYLCDGKNRTMKKPKKKRIKHIQIINQTVEENLLNRLLKKETVFDEQIKYAIKQYSNHQSCKQE